MQRFQRKTFRHVFTSNIIRRTWEKVRTYEEIDGVFGILGDTPEPYMRFARDDNGISTGMDRLRGIGNAVVPYQAYPIFEVIAELERKGNDIR